MQIGISHNFKCLSHIHYFRNITAIFKAETYILCMFRLKNVSVPFITYSHHVRTSFLFARHTDHNKHNVVMYDPIEGSNNQFYLSLQGITPLLLPCRGRASTQLRIREYHDCSTFGATSVWLPRSLPYPKAESLDGKQKPMLKTPSMPSFIPHYTGLSIHEIYCMVTNIE